MTGAVKSADGKDLQLHVSADADVQGIADRTWLSQAYQVTADVDPALGYDALGPSRRD